MDSNIDLSKWEFKGTFADLLIYSKGNERILVDKDTQKVTHRFKVKGHQKKDLVAGAYY